MSWCWSVAEVEGSRPTLSAPFRASLATRTRNTPTRARTRPSLRLGPAPLLPGCLSCIDQHQVIAPSRRGSRYRHDAACEAIELLISEGWNWVLIDTGPARILLSIRLPERPAI